MQIFQTRFSLSYLSAGNIVYTTTVTCFCNVNHYKTEFQKKSFRAKKVLEKKVSPPPPTTSPRNPDGEQNFLFLHPY